METIAAETAHVTIRSRAFAYWAATLFLALELVVGSGLDLFRAPFAVGTILRLRYPTYLLTILGVWKLLGAAALH